MSNFEYATRVPKDRIAVLIGKNGEIKKKIEEDTNTKLNIDSKEGEVNIEGSDGLEIYTTREIIKAVARGFNPEIALLLLKPDNSLDIINLADQFDDKRDIMRTKGRIIGTNGKTRKIIEDLTDSYLSVYGKTVSIIGFAENVAIARRAVEMLVQGAPHAKIYKYLEKQKKELRKMELGIYDK